MEISFNVTYRGAVPGTVNLSQSKWNNIIKEAWRKVGEYWLKHYLKKRFTKAGAAEYDLTPRDSKYEQGKRHKPGAGLPYVYSGELRSEAAKGARVQVTFFGRRPMGCKVFLPGARRVNMLDGIYREEFLSISPAEETVLARVFEGCVKIELARISTTTSRRRAA